MNVEHLFSQSSSEATKKFVAACKSRGALIQRFRHPMAGPDGPIETVSARIGPGDARFTFVAISGTHGLEGLAGAACQLSLLPMASDRGEAAWLFIHLLNPWGAAWHRRQNEANVDLNRNFADFGAEAPTSDAAYASVHDELGMALANAGASPDIAPHISSLLEREGSEKYAAALFRGQFSHSDGAGFGGTAPTWSRELFEALIDEHVRGCERAVLVDFHTGLGAYAHGELISTAPTRSSELDRLHRAFGADFLSLAERAEDMPYEVIGDLCAGFRRSLPLSDVTAIALEFGTYPVDRLVALQIEERFGRRSPVGGTEDLNKRLLDFFYPNDPIWRRKVIARSGEVAAKLLELLERPRC